MLLKRAYPQIIIRNLQSESEEIRLEAAQALVYIGEPAVEPLVNALRERGDHVWRLAAGVLVKIGEPAVGPLIEALYDDDEQVRILAAGALGNIGNERAVRPLIHVLQHEREPVRLLIVWAMVKIGQPAVGPLIEALRDNAASVQSSAARALGEIGDPLAVAPLLGMLHAKNAEVRRAVRAALEKLRYSQVKLSPEEQAQSAMS